MIPTISVNPGATSSATTPSTISNLEDSSTFRGRVWARLATIPQFSKDIFKNIKEKTNQYCIQPLIHLAYKIKVFAKKILRIQDTPTSASNSSKAETPSPTFPVGQKIKVPKDGNCFFSGFWWALKNTHAHLHQSLKNKYQKPENVKSAAVQEFLKHQDATSARLLCKKDLTSEESTKLLAEQTKVLRKLVVDFNKENLENLKDMPMLLGSLEKRNNVIPEIKKFDTTIKKQLYLEYKQISETIRHLKLSIGEHNEAIERSIKEATLSYQSYFQQAAELNESVNEAIFASNTIKPASCGVDEYHKEYRQVQAKISTLGTELAATQNNCARKTNELVDLRKQLIRCTADGFKCSEIKELIRYVDTIMSRDSNYVSYAEIATLANIFTTPIQITQAGIKTAPTLITTIEPIHWYNKSTTRPITLERQNEHYDLIVS